MEEPQWSGKCGGVDKRKETGICVLGTSLPKDPPNNSVKSHFTATSTRNFCFLRSKYYFHEKLFKKILDTVPFSLLCY